MTRYTKAWASFAALVLLIVGTELGADSKWYAYAAGALGLAAVFLFPNKDKADA